MISAKGMRMLGAADVLDVVSGGGGGGFGDPLLRNPEAVADDVRRARVSTEMAARVYGVVLVGEPPQLDADATSAARAEIKQARLARKTGSVDSDGASSCRGCGADPAPAFAYDEIPGESEPAELQPAEDMFLLRHRCCAECGTLLDVSLVVNER